MNDDLHDLFRGMASEGPSDDGLLDGVHAAAARAAVRRRVLVSSAAAVALVLGAIGVVSATGTDGPRTRDQVFGASGSPTSDVSEAPTPGPSTAPSAGVPGGTAAPERVYRGRAVSTQGAPVAGLYVYALPQGFPEVAAFHRWLSEHRPVTRTEADGSFSVPCPEGPVLLTAWPFHRAQDASTPNWAAVFVGGGGVPGGSTIPRCREGVETTRVAEGAVVQGTASGPDLPCPSTHHTVAVFGAQENSIFSWMLSAAWTHEAADGAFQVVGLPPGDYWVAAYSADDPADYAVTGYAQTRVEVTGSGLHQVELEPTRDDESSTCPAATPYPTGSPGPTPTPAPEPTP